jgi:O-antigen/teichoic acid export membrane protein
MALWISMLLRSHGQFVQGAAIERLPYALMFFAAPLAVRATDPLGAVLALQVALVILSVGLGALAVRTKVGRGIQVLAGEQRRAGAALAVHSLSLMTLTSGDVAIAGFLVAAESVAVYSVVLTLMSPFDLLRTSYQTLLLTEIGRRPSLTPRRVLPFVLAPTGLLLVLYIAFGAVALNFVYSGKFDAGETLIPILAAALLFQVIYSIFYSFIVVRSTTRALKGFVLVEIGLGALGAVWMFAATAKWGIAGTALSLGTAWFARMLVASAFAGFGTSNSLRGGAS